MNEEEKLVAKLKDLYETRQIFDPELTELAKHLHMEFKNPYATYIEYVICVNDPDFDGPDSDWVKYSYLKEAADGGHPEGLFGLGCTYFYGQLGYAIDWELAFMYLSQASTAGFTNDDGELKLLQDAMQDGVVVLNDYLKLMHMDIPDEVRLQQLKIWLDEGKITKKAFKRNMKIFNDVKKLMKDL